MRPQVPFWFMLVCLVGLLSVIGLNVFAFCRLVAATYRADWPWIAFWSVWAITASIAVASQVVAKALKDV